MKFDITIKDATLEEVQSIVSKLSGAAATVQNNYPALTAERAYVGEPETEETHNSADVTGQVDAEGLPWDARIHSSNKKKTSKNIWVARRGVDDATRNQVVAELRGHPSLPSLTTVQSHELPPAVSTLISPAPYTPAPVYAHAPTNQAPAPFNPATVLTPVVQDINALFAKIQHLVSNGKIDGNYIIGINNRLSNQFGVVVNSINDIANRPDMISAAFQMFAADGN